MRNHTAPVTYRLEHRVNDIMRQHDAKLKLDPSLPAYPEHLLWHWHPAKGCRLPLATHDGLCRALQALGLRRIFIVGDSMQWNFAQALWKLFSGAPGDPARVHSKKNGKGDVGKQQ